MRGRLRRCFIASCRRPIGSHPRGRGRSSRQRSALPGLSVRLHTTTAQRDTFRARAALAPTTERGRCRAWRLWYVDAHKALRAHTQACMLTGGTSVAHRPGTAVHVVLLGNGRTRPPPQHHTMGHLLPCALSTRAGLPIAPLSCPTLLASTLVFTHASGADNTPALCSWKDQLLSRSLRHTQMHIPRTRCCIYCNPTSCLLYHVLRILEHLLGAGQDELARSSVLKKGTVSGRRRYGQR